MIVRILTNVGANATVDNIVQGRSIEFAADDSRMTLAAATPLPGINMSARLTDEVVLDESVVPDLAGGNPVIPDQVLVGGQPVARGDHLIIRLTNTTGLAADVITLIDIAPI